VPPNRSPTDVDLQAAADLAAHFSRARGQARVEVIAAQASNVRPQRGSGVKPGQAVALHTIALFGSPAAGAACDEAYA
jgi:predicted ribosome quality control (RQC) complex YloA/Tae2 family protein